MDDKLMFSDVLEGSKMRFKHDADSFPKALGFESEEEFNQCREKFKSATDVLDGKGCRSKLIEKLMQMSAPTHWRVLWLIDFGRTDALYSVGNSPEKLAGFVATCLKIQAKAGREGGAE